MSATAHSDDYAARLQAWNEEFVLLSAKVSDAYEADDAVLGARLMDEIDELRRTARERVGPPGPTYAEADERFENALGFIEIAYGRRVEGLDSRSADFGIHAAGLVLAALQVAEAVRICDEVGAA